MRLIPRARATVPVLTLTARAEDADKAIGLGIGASDYLTKPFIPTDADQAKGILGHQAMVTTPGSFNDVLGTKEFVTWSRKAISNPRTSASNISAAAPMSTVRTLTPDSASCRGGDQTRRYRSKP